MEGISEFFQDTLTTLAEALPNILIALGVLIGGWLLALLGRALTRATLTRTGVDRRIASLFGATEKTSAVRVASWTSRIVYYLILLFVLAAILQVLQQVLPAQGTALEIASGTGQHVALFATHLPGWVWQPSDAQDYAFDSIRSASPVIFWTRRTTS